MNRVTPPTRSTKTRIAQCSIASALLFAMTSCATTAAPVATANLVSTGELEPAMPTNNTEARANTETSSSVALSGRRDRVRDAIDAYLHAIVEQDVDGAMAVFSANPTLVENNAPYRAVADLTEHHRRALSGTYDMAFLRIELDREGGGPQIRSQAEFRRLYPGGYLAVQPGDWIVDLPFTMRAPYNAVARYLPSRMVFRFVGSTPKVVALATLMPLRA